MAKSYFNMNSLKSGDWVLAYTITKDTPTRIRVYDSKWGSDGGMMVYGYHPHFPDGHEWGMLWKTEAPIIRKMTPEEISLIPQEVRDASDYIADEKIDYSKDLVSV